MAPKKMVWRARSVSAGSSKYLECVLQCTIVHFSASPALDIARVWAVQSRSKMGGVVVDVIDVRPTQYIG